MEKLLRFGNSQSTRLQLAMLFLSLVGIAFGVKSYLHVREIFGAVESAVFLKDLQIQIAIAVAINIVVGYLLNCSIIKPIKQLGDVMCAIAEKKLGIAVPYTDKRNEIGTLSRRIQIFKDNAINLKNLQREQEDNQTNAETERKELLDNLASEFNTTVQEIVNNVNASAVNMEKTSSSVVSAVHSSNERFSELNNQSSHASENVNNIAAAAEELSVSIENITKQVTRSTDITKEAVNKADSANRTIEGLSDGTRKIGQVMNIINDIAEQINLLALNATIEAARAGEAGKGFAVVASEVKNLASETAKATDEIVSVITGLQNETSASVESIQEISKTINEISTISTAILGAVNEQDLSTRDIARHIQEAAQHTNGVNDNIATVSNNSHQIGDSANALLSVCNELTQHSNALNDEMTRFVGTMKSA